ncbi:MAG TPA: hypothetical protein VFA26_02225 [Gemmataceae bacterium]|nr:hypothetical protein [Gemmataceae bacterium]
MHASLRAFLSGVVDYAGLFPPAKLPLDDSIRNYARYRTGPDAWMLGRFICPAARLGELMPYLPELFADGPPLAVSALGRGGNTLREFLEGLRDDLEALLAFRAKCEGRAVVDVLELKLPGELLRHDREKELGAAVHGPAELLARAGGAPALFCEIPFEPGWGVRLAFLLRALAQDPGRGKGFKFRCGGLEASAFPPPGDVALALTACRQERVPLKFTAGLHHPVRHFDRGVRAMMHGFLNVFGAGVLAFAHGLDRDRLLPLLEDEDAADFVFDEAGFRWQGLRATTAQIEAARRQLVLSFGSCSFDEPRDDLRALGLLR